MLKILVPLGPLMNDHLVVSISMTHNVIKINKKIIICKAHKILSVSCFQ